MSEYTSKSRNTEAARELEIFLDNYSKAEFAEGYGSLVSTLEDVAESVDSIVGDLESEISELQQEILELKNQIEQLEEEQ